MIQKQQLEEKLQKMGEFMPDCNKKILHDMFQRIQRHFIKETWNLSDRKFRDINAKQFFNLARKIHGKILMAGKIILKKNTDYNKNPLIINDIVRPMFCQLHTLYLGDNNIYSIQSLRFMNTPQLKSLSLNDNHIVNLKSFSKCYFPKLEYFSLNGNKIGEYQHLQNSNLFQIKIFKIADQIPDNRNWEIMNVLWLLKTSLNQKDAEISFNPKFIVTPEVFLFKLKIRRKKYIPPLQATHENSSSCSPLPLSE